MDLHELVKHAMVTKKPTKTEAFNILKNLAIKLNVDNSNCFNDIASLLSFFNPPKPPKPKTPEQWVQNFLTTNKNEPIQQYKYLYVQDGKCYGTDGGSIAIAKTELSDGWYYPKNFTPVGDESNDWEYKDTSFLFELEVLQTSEVKWSDITGGSFGTVHTDDQSYWSPDYYLSVGDINFNLLLVKRMFIGDEAATVKQLYFSDETMVLGVENKFGTAYLMPLRE